MIISKIRKSGTINWFKKSTVSLARSGKFPPTPIGLSKQRRSDILFVLGSGSSINQITNWDTVEACDSVGFNFWMLHEFVPTFYFFEAESWYDKYTNHIHSSCELANSNLPGRLASFSRLITLKAESYRETSLFIKQRPGCKAIELLIERSGLAYHPFVSESFALSTGAQLADRCTQLRKSYLTRSLRFFSQGVASVELLVVFAWQMGYSKVVLCGVDLNNTNYFFYDQRYRHLANEGLIPPSLQTGQNHKTNDPAKAWGGVAVQEVLEIYQKDLLKQDCQIYVENPHSALADAFPLFSLRNMDSAAQVSLINGDTL